MPLLEAQLALICVLDIGPVGGQLNKGTRLMAERGESH